MYLQFSVDWLHLTMPYSDIRPLQANLYPLQAQREVKYTAARYGYSVAGENRLGAKVMANPDRPDMGVHVSYPASTLREYGKMGVHSVPLLRWHMGLGARCSRIDLALDVHESRLSIVALYEQLVAGNAMTRIMNYTLLKGQDDGTTLYIGSRQSELMLRIYDKAKEQGVVQNWKRLELEAKGDRAQQIATELAQTDDENLLRQIKRYIVGVVTFADPSWSEMLHEVQAQLAPASKKQTDTTAWLLNVAAPSLGKQLGRSRDPKLLTEFLRIVRVNRYRETMGE